MAEHMTEQQLKKYLGWTEGSNMAAVYVHLSGKDIDNAVLKMNGIDFEERQEDNALKTTKCPKCGELQDARNEACCRCWVSFKSGMDESVISEVQELREMVEQLKREVESRKEIETTVSDILNNYSNMFDGPDRGKELFEKEELHWQRMRNDLEYRRMIEEYKGSYIYERFGDPASEKAFNEMKTEEWLINPERRKRIQKVITSEHRSIKLVRTLDKKL